MAQDGPVLERARTFAAEPIASRQARYFVVEWLEAHNRGEFADRIGLAVSELAANAVLHTTRPFTVGLELGDGTVRLELVDSAPTRMAVPVPTSGSAVDITSISETGRGLQIVGALANRWGIVVDPNVKTVWAEFAAEHPVEPTEPELVDRRPPEPPHANLRKLRYLRMPVRAAIESGLDVETATRDLQWIEPDELSEEDRALLALVEQSASLRLAGRHAAMHAASNNELHFDLELAATDDALLALELLSDALSRRPSSQRRQPPSDEVTRFRRWLREETMRQRDGAAPRPYTEDIAPEPDPFAWLLEKSSAGYVSVRGDGTVVAVNAALSAFIGREVAPGTLLAGYLVTAARDAFDPRQHGDCTLRFATGTGPVAVTGRATCEGGLTRIVVELPSQHAGELLHALQQTLIPPEPPSVPGLDVAAAYHPAQGEVGGDFYDVFEVAADDWCVVLGDVSGKGVDAAIVTSAARHAVRSSALREPVPSGLMHALNGALVAQNSSRFCTVVLARLQRHHDSWIATFTTGGHPFPLLVRHGTATRMGRPGSLLGVFEDVNFFDVSIKLAVGDALVLFTDGIIEARNERGELFGDERLHDAVVHAPPTAAGIVDAVLEKVLAYQAGHASDDIAVVVIRRTEL
jgi:PAS domain-containing protein/anti-sigma regulatory factor (Ser/Thr protein kinase)